MRPLRSTPVRSTAVAAALALLLAGCGGATLTPTGSIAEKPAPAARAAAATTAPSMEPQGERAPVKVGLILPLSGPGQAGLVADTLKKAAELAVADLGARHVELVVRDDKGTPEAAAAAADDLAAGGAEIILGPLFATSVAAAAPAARRANIPVVAFSNDRQVAGPGVHLLSFLAPPEINRVISFAAERGKKRIAALLPDDAYGRLLEASLREAAGRAGGKVVAVEMYPAGGGAIAPVMVRLRDQIRGVEEHGDPVDALFLPGGDEQTNALLAQLKTAGIDLARIKLIATGALDGPGATQHPGLAGAWYAGPDPKGFAAFADKYTRAHGHAPPRIATLAYDAIGLVVALSGGPRGARYIPAQLTRASGFTGIDGAFRLTADGITDRALAILEVQAGGAVVIDPAPARIGIDNGSLAALPRTN
jgi:ABC-type branched-subunit amino acid transport system substrate-binding protein